ncbi:MAG: 23S rRNA (guanosine(2251)-2'-O)-methyltransferase RlmB [Clostridiaceae bacterium]|nr:23S rRNA (guanosine(2251)-2'-O)-methyltransferase RlmB [Clostridiaceae bacterium]
MAFNRNPKGPKTSNYSKPSRPGRPGKPGKFEKRNDGGFVKEEGRYSKGPTKGRSSGKPYDKAKPFEKGKPFEKDAPYRGSRLKEQYKTDNKREDDVDDDNINLIEGRNPVIEALKSGREIDKIFVQKGVGEGSIRQIIAIAREKKILIKEVDKAKLDGLSSTRNHQGVIASAALYKYYEVDDILKAAREKGEDPFIVILDEITDNNNLGSILRTADAAGVHGIIIPQRRAVGLTPAVAKISSGAIEYVPVAKVTNLNHTIEYLKKEGLWIAGAEMGGEAYHGKDMTGPIALVIGSEGEGLGRLIRENCDFLVSIPMKGKISSLNAAVSAAIILFEIQKQRETKKV